LPLSSPFARAPPEQLRESRARSENQPAFFCRPVDRPAFFGVRRSGRRSLRPRRLPPRLCVHASAKRVHKTDDFGWFARSWRATDAWNKALADRVTLTVKSRVISGSHARRRARSQRGTELRRENQTGDKKRAAVAGGSKCETGRCQSPGRWFDALINDRETLTRS